MTKFFSAAMCAAMLAGAAELPSRKTLTLEAAKQIAAAAEAEARKNKWIVAIAVCDDAGYLIYGQRMDDAQLVSLELAHGKARTAALYKRPTKLMEEAVAGGRTVMLKFPGALPARGGLPIVVDGKVIGAIGVSGVLPEQDEQIGQTGIDALLKR